MPVPLTTPAFGHATLANCEREQIHLAGSIQPHGILLAVKEPDNLVIQASTNAAAFLNTNSVVGRPLRDLGGDLALQILPHLNGPLHLAPMTLRCAVGTPPRRVDCTIHRPSNGGLIIELEPATKTTNIAPALDGAFHRITSASSLLGLSDETATIFKEITGYDRVMVYRFDDEGHGEVLSERRRPELEAFLGNRYPASDIPQIVVMNKIDAAPELLELGPSIERDEDGVPTKVFVSARDGLGLDGLREAIVEMAQWLSSRPEAPAPYDPRLEGLQPAQDGEPWDVDDEPDTHQQGSN